MTPSFLFRIVSACSCLLFLLGSVHAQTYLEGRVVSQAEPKGVAGALVYLRGTNYGAYTDSIGQFRFAYQGRLPD